MTNVGGATYTYEAQSRNMINMCTKYGFDIFIWWTQMTHDVRQTTPGVQHQLPTAELKPMLGTSSGFYFLQNVFMY